MIAVLRSNANGTHERIARLKARGHHRAATACETAYRFTHGFTPAEHAYLLMVQERLASDRWRPQP